MLLGVLLPAIVVALVGDVALCQLGLQLPQVQPRLVVLGDGRRVGWGGAGGQIGC